MKLKKLKDNSKLIEAINHKMNDCTKNQKSLYEYITSDGNHGIKMKNVLFAQKKIVLYIFIIITMDF